MERRVLFVVFIGLIGLTIGLNGTAHASTSVVDDIFKRTQSTLDDWGSATTFGGIYGYVNNDTPAAFFMNGGLNGSDGMGAIEAPAAGSYREADLASAQALDVDSKVQFQLSALPAGGSVVVQLAARGVRDGTQYAASVSVSQTGGLSYGVAKRYLVNGSVNRVKIGTWQSANGLTANQAWMIRVQVVQSAVGVATLQMKLWKQSNPEPASWAYAATDGEPSLITTGYQGLRVDSNSGLTNAPDVSFDAFHVDDIQPPALTGVVIQGGSLSPQSVPSVTVSACCVTIPPGSPGFDHYEYRYNTTGTWTGALTGASFVDTAQGYTVIQFRAVDSQGNPSVWFPTTDTGGANIAWIDRGKPTTPTVYGGSSTWLNVASETVAACCSKDAVTDVTGYEYRTSINGGSSWSPPTAGSTVTISSTGETLVQFRSDDQTGNHSAWTPTTPSDGSTVRIDPSLPTQSVTTIAGGTHITTNSTWTTAASPYLLMGSMYVDAGVTLTIQAGVEVRVHPVSPGLDTIHVSGTMSTSPTVTFTAEAAPRCTAGSFQGPYWFGISFEGGTASTLNGARVCYAGFTPTGVRTYGAVIVQGNASPTLLNCDVVGSGNSGIAVLNGSVSLSGTTVRGSQGDGLFVFQSTATVQSGSSLVDNGWGGAYFELSNTVARSTVTDSDISGNGSPGVTLATGTLPLQLWPTGNRNNIEGNDAVTSAEAPHQLTASGADPQADWTNNYFGPAAWALPCPWALAPYQPYNMRNGAAWVGGLVWDKTLEFLLDAAKDVDELDFPFPFPFPSPAFPGDWIAVDGGFFSIPGPAVHDFNPCQGDYVPTSPTSARWNHIAQG